MTRTRSRRVLVPAIVWIAAVFLASEGCGRRTAPASEPLNAPSTLPSEEEAQRVREGAPEAIPLPPEPGQVPEETAVPGSSPAAPIAEEEGSRPGYRVQLFATTDPGLAEARAVEMRQLFDEQVYVELEGELFKVRVGDCATRDEAANLRRRALGLGLEGAFIVDAFVHER